MIHFCSLFSEIVTGKCLAETDMWGDTWGPMSTLKNLNQSSKPFVRGPSEQQHRTSL